MATIQPHIQHQDQYRLPPPPGTYQRPPDLYPPTAPAPPHVVYQAAAPRQRTAIACRYCRRRKIRCSGFDTSQDGRCSNCVRFNQECMFTPVSSQAQAFVPAHAAYPHLRNSQVPPRGGGRSGYPADGVMLYGAHGQPLPPPHPSQHGPDTTLPPPQAMYQHPYGRPPQIDDRNPPPLAHPPVLQDQQRLSRGRRGSAGASDYTEPSLAPVSSAAPASHYPTQHSPAQGYYPTPPQDRRSSSHSAYSYDPRHSASPHGSASSTAALPYPSLHPSQGPQTLPATAQTASVTTAQVPPSSGAPGGSGRSGLSVRDMLGPGDGQGGRSSTDSDMLNMLNRRGLNQ